MSAVKPGVLAASILMSVFILSVTASAEDVQSVIITTETNCPDALVTGVAGSRIGAPVLVTARDTLSSEVSAQIESLSPETVYIVGGPAVVSQSLEDELLESNYSVVRLWGLTRYGTSAEVALEFWESAPKVMLVSDVLGTPSSGRCELISEAKDLAMQYGIPVLLVAGSSVPVQTAEALENLSTVDVVLVGNTGSAVTDTLQSMGITVSERIGGADDNATRALLREKVKERIRHAAGKPLVVVAVGNWSDTINAPYLTNGTSRHISSESEIDTLISEINDNDYTRILIVGKPDLARIIYGRLTEEGINATLVSGRPAYVAAKVMQHELSWIRERARAMKAQIEELCEKRAAYAEEHFGDDYAKVKAFIENSVLSDERKQSALSWLEERKASFNGAIENGSYCAAWEKYSAVQGKMSDLAYRYKEALASAYRTMLEKEKSISEDLSKLRELARRIKERSDAAAGN